MKKWASAGIVSLLAAVTGAPTSAHVTVVSPYTFNQDVLPILRERCGSCHGEHGPGRPLLEFAQARRSQVEIERSLMVGRMPPWSAEAGAVAFKGQQTLTLRELDTIMTWGIGGAPEGTAPPSPAVAAEAGASSARTPDLTMEMRSSFVLEAGRATAVHEEVFDAKEARGRAIRMVDLMPGDPSIVGRAEVAIRTSDGDRTIALWAPGDAPQTLEADAAYAVPRDASIVLRTYYMRQPGGGGEPRADRSRIGLFFSRAEKPPNPRDLVIVDTGAFRVDEPRVVSQQIAQTVRALAIRPVSGPLDAIVALEIVGTAGERRPLARLQLRTGWPRRYILSTPVTLQAGERIDARVSRWDPVLSSLTGDEGIPANEDSLRIAIEVID